MTRVGDRPMFEELNLDAIEDRLIQLETGNVDVVVPAKHINYNPEGFIVVDGRKFGLPNWPFRQLAKLVGLNAKMLREAPSGTGKASRHALVTYWLDKLGDKPILLRLKDTGVVDEKTGADGRLRGVMASRGTIPFSARDLLSSLRPYLKQYNMAVQLGNAREQAFHLRTVFREGVEVAKPSREDKVHVVPTLRAPGSSPATQDVHGNLDTHALGIHWRMSEVGFCPLSADMLIFRQVCANGMIALTEKTGLISKRTATWEEQEFRTEIGLSIERARDRQNEILERLTGLRDAKLVDPIYELRTFLQMRNEQEVNKEFIANVEQAYKEEPMPTKYGVLQAITRAARKYHFDSGRLVFEAVAGSYLDTAGLR